MIKITNTTTRDLSKIAEGHKEALLLILQRRIHARIKNSKQSKFLIHWLPYILTGRPYQLLRVNNLFNRRLGRTKGFSALVEDLPGIFNYKQFVIKSEKYCAYHLAASLGVNTCPYCNRNYTVTISGRNGGVVRPDFDHFFPKSKYPLLALSFYNLVPSCSLCNRTVKGVQELEYGRSIHPYEEGFEDSVKFSHIPQNFESLIGLKNDFEIKFIKAAGSGSMKAEHWLSNINLFKLKEIYEQSHGTEIAELIRRYTISSGTYLEVLYNQFKGRGLASFSELYQLAFGNYYELKEQEKRPLSKLTRDITEQLNFLIPHGYLKKENE